MKLLFDQHLSFHLVQLLDDLYPDSVHVRRVGLANAEDGIIWEFAREHGYTIVSKDTDFYYLSIRFGPSPKVVWLRLGNCTTAAVALMLRQYHAILLAFEGDQPSAFLALA